MTQCPMWDLVHRGGVKPIGGEGREVAKATEKRRQGGQIVCRVGKKAGGRAFWAEGMAWAKAKSREGDGLFGTQQWQYGPGGREWEPGSWATGWGKSPAPSLPTRAAAGGHSDIAFFLTRKAFTGPTKPGVV